MHWTDASWAVCDRAALRFRLNLCSCGQVLNDGFSRLSGPDIYNHLNMARDELLLALKVMRQVAALI